jgi:hypothetical protein
VQAVPTLAPPAYVFLLRPSYPIVAISPLPSQTARKL